MCTVSKVMTKKSLTKPMLLQVVQTQKNVVNTKERQPAVVGLTKCSTGDHIPEHCKSMPFGNYCYYYAFWHAQQDLRDLQDAGCILT